MAHFVKQLSAKVSSAMEGADEKALQSKRFKDLMKNIEVRYTPAHNNVGRKVFDTLYNKLQAAGESGVLIGHRSLSKRVSVVLVPGCLLMWNAWRALACVFTRRCGDVTAGTGGRWRRRR